MLKGGDHMTYAKYRPEPAYDLVRWAWGEPGLGTEDLMRPGNYSPAIRIKAFLWRVSDSPSAVATRDGIGTMHAQSFASKHWQESYALRVELGLRAYAELTGKRVKRTKAPAKPKVNDLRQKTRERIRRSADGGTPVVLSDHDMMVALGIKPIGFLE